MQDKIENIKKTLLKKSSVKQQVSKTTHEVFNELTEILKDFAQELTQDVSEKEPAVKIKFFPVSEFEAHLKFSGDTLVFMLHTNTFDFDKSHPVHRLQYIKDDPSRKYCGMIQVYNFLSDSLKYNREEDYGHLIARIFINRERHFFMEGKRSLALMYKDFDCCSISTEELKTVVLESMKYCLDFELVAPPLELVSFLTVSQKNLMSFSSGIPTGKTMGFLMQTDLE